MMTIDEQLAYLTKGAAETIRVEDLRVKLERSAKTGKPLRVKTGLILRRRIFIWATPCSSAR